MHMVCVHMPAHACGLYLCMYMHMHMHMCGHGVNLLAWEHLGCIGTRKCTCTCTGTCVYAHARLHMPIAQRNKWRAYTRIHADAHVLCAYPCTCACTRTCATRNIALLCMYMYMHMHMHMHMHMCSMCMYTYVCICGYGVNVLAREHAG